MSTIGKYISFRQENAGYSPMTARLYDIFATPYALKLGKYLAETFIDKSSIDKGSVDKDKSTLKILDVGCGGGQLVEWIAKNYSDRRSRKNFSIEITGLDYSTEQINLATKRLRKSKMKVEFFMASALDMPFEDNTFDLIVSVGSIKHWPDRSKGLKECYRVTKPGGTLAICELDPQFSARRLTGMLGLPKRASVMLRPLKIGWQQFLTFSIPLDDAIDLARELNAKNITAKRVDSLPITLISGQK